MRLVVATRNQGKFREIAELLKGHELLPLSAFPDIPEVLEDGRTFRENAFKKAREICRQTGLPALADDSGLEVDRLGGAPGVQSARYAGPRATDGENIQKLLSQMQAVPGVKRGARYVCVLVLCLPAGREFAVEGECRGVIALQPQGSGGFGYDPVFYLPELRKTMAELTADEKNRLSHRAAALHKLREVLAKFVAK